MKVSRGELLARLTEAAIGLSGKEVLEQSSSFVFKGGRLITFNDDIMVRLKSPLDFDVVVGGSDLMGVLGRMPDEEVDVVLRDGELLVRGEERRRTAGIACVTEVHLPIDAVEVPGKWLPMEEGCMSAMQQAAQTCGQDETQYLTTVVHVTPDRVEACDNFRLLRIDGPTGFPGEVLIPASSISKLEGLDLKKVALGKGWAHFKTAGGAEISVRCSHQKYHDGVDKLLEMDGPEDVQLPNNLAEILERAEVMTTASYDTRVGVKITDEELVLTSRKATGWYRERKRVRYSGRPLSFEVHPKFLGEVLARTRNVSVDGRKMKIVSDRVLFVVALTTKAEKADEEDVPPAEEKAPKGRRSAETVKFRGDDIPF